MTDSLSDSRTAAAAGGRTRWTHFAALGAVCVSVIGVYAWSANSGALEFWGLGAADTYYNLLVQGFRAGQLNVKREAPPGLVQLADPYDSVANGPFRCIERYPLEEMSYYKGKLYLYFGVTPALLLFWPYVALTGHYLLHKEAVVIFFSVGFLASVGLLWAVWRRYFMDIHPGLVAAGALALGLADFTPAILSRCDVYEVPISCGYALTMLALVGIWGALHAVRWRGCWLAAASLVYGLALGSRPSLLFGAVILLVPVAQAWHQQQRVWPLLLPAAGPLLLIGLGLMLYNAMRFGNPLDFGQHYQLVLIRQGTTQQFSLRYLWFNFRLGFLEPARWSGQFPFVHDIAVPPLPRGAAVEHPFGVLTNVPLVWLALAAPLAWYSRPAEARSTLRWFIGAVALLFGTCALILVLHNSMCLRYEVEFLPALALLAVIGILGLERALAVRPAWRIAVRCGWGLLLAFSLGFNLCASVQRQAEVHDILGAALFQRGHVDEAIFHFQKALQIQPDDAEVHYDLGTIFLHVGRFDEAIAHFQKALEIRPDYAAAHNNLGGTLLRKGRVDEAISQYQQALRLRPGYVEASNNLAAALAIQRTPTKQPAASARP